jgi:hypothetical protein
MAYEAVSDNELAAVVTYLEMRARVDQPVIWSPLSLERVEVPQPEHYRELFRLVGAPWLWFSRLILDDVHLAEIVQHPKVELYAVHDEDGREVGILELDFREPHECELAFIGLVPAPGAKASTESMSTPARSTIRRRLPPTAAPASFRTSVPSSGSPTLASSASCRGNPLLRSRFSERSPDPFRVLIAARRSARA